MTDAAAVSLDVATERDSALLSNLLEFYMHDLSEIFPIDLNPKGRFDYDRLQLYWAEPETRFAFLIRSAGQPVGFALVTRGSPASDDPDVLDVAEFFVLRRFRRGAVGRQAATLLWNRLRGNWIVRVAESNRAGIPFWTRIIEAYTGGKVTVSALQGNTQMFRVFSFQS
jgi:predicted acetyltransferase